ncbi:efflux RND transporter periplasmic adaptor subunit [Hymenobacter sp. 15J16-1T3B]|uniref:efflux RND transporter periplasmic adaptor subunit n=1 Tax=Hymenobacter sp. 15J16-1T3B TaxID=2886941 RepID=UPI001D119574|nr:efflux RND transporter periplasmic adaptor subunit [Hymenobacter sp. 15J16-1T3B]MCC3159735.1 efflux RND transporter periplasmic adaptor subunit [Hymenobacter sp. 15J16-1T3B]
MPVSRHLHHRNATGSGRSGGPCFYPTRWLWLGGLVLVLLGSCGPKAEHVRPVVAPISECVYAAGTVKSAGQYQAFASVGGLIKAVYVREGDSVQVGTPLLAIAGDVPQLAAQNAALAARYADVAANQDQLREAQTQVDLQRRTLADEQRQLERQRRLWAQSIGTRQALEQRELAYAGARTAYTAALARYHTLQRQLDFAARQARTNLQIARQQTRDFVLRSRVRGVVYKLYPRPGEAVSPQTPLALLGEARRYVLEMQVDEADIVRIRPGQPVLVTLDSYAGQVFPARVTAVVPLMNAGSKTFLVEAGFVRRPPVLYPQLSFEASIVLRTKRRALLVPRRALVNDSTVLNGRGEPVPVRVGLRDYQMVEILGGLGPGDELTVPAS